MTKADILTRLQELALPKTDYWLIAGSAMVLYGIREQTHDIDMGCTSSLADQLEASGYSASLMDDGTRKYTIGEDIEIFENWLYDTVTEVDQIPVISIAGLLEMKQVLGREKDFCDIRLIEDFAKREDLPMETKAILFDLDGTLTDSGEGIINCAIMTLEHYGLPVPSREEMRVFVGPPLHESFIRHGVPAEKAEEAIRIYRSRYVPIGAYENTPYPGIRELLEQLKAAGHRLYVATSKPEAMSVKILEHFDLAKYFDMICGASLDTSRSTKEAVIEYLLEQNGRADNITMVGDTKFDVLGAKEHGIPCIGVSWGYGTVEDMVAAGAKAIAYTMEELLELLK